MAALIGKLEQRMASARRASEDAVAYATDEDSKADSKWDTQGLEASYLAAGQANQVRVLYESIQNLKAAAGALAAPLERVGLGAVVGCELGGEVDVYFLAPEGGGEVIELDGRKVTVITPGSPLFERLGGRRAGEAVSLPSGASMRIESVA